MTDEKLKSLPDSQSAQLFAEALRTLGGSVPKAMTEWTEEQWAARDAQVAADREAQRHIVEDMPPRHELEDHGWPHRALRIAMEVDRSSPAVTRLMANVFSRSNVIVLSGPPGCGKTVAAACWTLDRKIRSRFVRASTFAAASRYNADQRNEWFSAPALVLDDLGAEYLDAKGSFMVDLDELVDTFYGSEKPLIITTNCTLDQFRSRYGERVVDRLRESASWISVSNSSLRSRS